jgi:mannose-1-phosphate guanylyltransferase/mannose-6-phosphate isomerase
MKINNIKKQFAIILCGGSGARLWPLSRSLRPKQLLQLNGEETLLQQTVARVCQKISPSNLFTVTNQSLYFEVKGQLAEQYPEALTGVIQEPTSKNTLPAAALAVNKIYQKDPKAIIGVFASDHAIKDEQAFLEAWSSAESAAEQGYLTLIGIKPSDAVTGYGYIRPANNLNLVNTKYPVFEVDAFVEKPDLSTAHSYLTSGYLWNSGMFIFRADVFMEMLERYQPQLHRKICMINDENILELYEDLPSISIDYGLAEKADRVAVVPADMAWSDLGSWESIFQQQQKNNDNNVIRGDILTEDTKNSLLWSETGLLTALGVDNLIVISTADAVLVCDRNRSEDVKLIVSQIRDRYPHMAETHLTVQRPWGTYSVLETGENFKIKNIVVKPHQKLSLQLHNHRSEHWVVLSGIATVTNGDAVFKLNANESTYIYAGIKHRLENQGDSNLVIIEVQSGEIVDESDIIRFEDIYKRIS